ncbi:MAG TPA: AgmX/PglI C-terminal domain-containing protein [Candidatus Dormibacteraeota bacterium]|nr:AgmX/PglI C-terminal domain-containing protein [Candidatus Dormibacteraeota bacterium]
MSVTSGAPSTRSMLTSLAIHVLAMVLVLLVPAEALSRSPRPKTEVDVVFHRPPRIEVSAPAAPRPPSREASTARLPPSPVVPPKPSPAAPGEPAPVAEASPRQRVGNSGILAFRDQLASLARDKKIAPRLGAEARYGAANDVGKPSSPSTLTTNAPGSSGGINLASLSHSVGGGSGGGEGGIPGVAVGRATSPIAGGGGGGGGGGGSGGVGGRPLSRGGPGPSRTDEEIQIVFDRYKASFYRLYNRALRNDPTLKGQMVLRLTIEADGSVSMCKLQSSDMNAPDLAAQVVNIVRTINFGAKDGVQALTIAYPIDFLPAA